MISVAVVLIQPPWIFFLSTTDIWMSWRLTYFNRHGYVHPLYKEARSGFWSQPLLFVFSGRYIFRCDTSLSSLTDLPSRCSPPDPQRKVKIPSLPIAPQPLHMIYI